MRVSVAEADVAKPVEDGVPMSEQVFTFADKPLLFEIRMATDDDEGEILGVARCSLAELVAPASFEATESASGDESD